MTYLHPQSLFSVQNISVSVYFGWNATLFFITNDPKHGSGAAFFHPLRVPLLWLRLEYGSWKKIFKEVFQIYRRFPETSLQFSLFRTLEICCKSNTEDSFADLSTSTFPIQPQSIDQSRARAYVCKHMSACVLACVRACARAWVCLRACVRVRVRVRACSRTRVANEISLHVRLTKPYNWSNH